MGCTQWPDCENNNLTIFGMLINIKINNEEFYGIIKSQYDQDNAPCDEIKNIGGTTGCVVNLWFDPAGSITFS
jgi:hypothetical protein